MGAGGSGPLFFPTRDDWFAWLEKNHHKRSEVVVGFYKRQSGKPSITWPESVDGALCYGWIDGVRRKLDEDSYSIRFTPRRPRSTWSAINIRRAGELKKQGLMRPAGEAAFRAREKPRSAIYSFEQKEIAFDPEQEKAFRSKPAAWAFFHQNPPWYRRTATWWVISAKRSDTRERRLATLISDSEAGRTIRQLTRPGKPSGK